MKKTSVLILAGVLAAGLPMIVAAADDLTKKCASCHGADGNSDNEKVPNIAGMSVAYFTESMKGYKEGGRPALKVKSDSGEETDMNEVAKKLTDADVQTLASFYSGKKFVPRKQPVDASKAAAGKRAFKSCEKCHEEGGRLSDDDVYTMAGQWKPYLQHEFKLFASGEREMPKKMASAFKKLSKEQQEAIIEFLAAAK